jgi:hypothetical protein
VSEATLYTCKSKYGGMEVNEARRLRELEEENRRLKQLVARSQSGSGSFEGGHPKKTAGACRPSAGCGNHGCRLWRQ